MYNIYIPLFAVVRFLIFDNYSALPVLLLNSVALYFYLFIYF